MPIIKLAISFSSLFALWMSLWLSPALLAEEPHKEKAAPDAVLSLAEKTLDAIRDKDAGFLAALVDPTGIYIGFDAPKMSAAQFKEELTAKRGVYCVILDASCMKGDFANSPTASSLRQILIAQPVRMTAAMQDAQGSSQVVSVTVKKATNPKEELFTLYFRQVGDQWRLQHIDYV